MCTELEGGAYKLIHRGVLLILPDVGGAACYTNPLQEEPGGRIRLKRPRVGDYTLPVLLLSGLRMGDFGAPLEGHRLLKEK